MKKWYQSKTLIVNILTLLLTVIGSITGAIMLNENTLKILGVAITVINIVLRFLTTTGITGNAKPEDKP